MEGFYRSFFSEGFKVAGYNLKPFCLGHLALLRALNSPFAKEEQLRPIDIIIFLKVCSSSYPFQPKLRLSFFDRFRIYLMIFNHYYFKKILNSCADYMQEFRNFPEYYNDDLKNSLRPMSAPSELSSVVNLIKNGIPHQEAWEMSLAYAQWFNATVNEQAGDTRGFYDPLGYTKAPPPLQLTEAEEVELAREKLPPKIFQKWLKARSKNGSRI